MLDARPTHVGDEPDGVVRQLVVTPVGDRRLDEGLVGIGRRGFILGSAHHDARIGLLHHVQQHVRILLLWPLGAVALRIGVRRHVERVDGQRPHDVALDIRAELRVDLVQHRLAVPQRPQLADRLVAHAHHDAADLVELRIDIGALVVPVLLRLRQLQREVAALAAGVIDVGHRRAVLCLVCHVVEARPQRHDRPERGMRCHVGNTLAVDPDLAAIAQGIEILRTGSEHGVSSIGWSARWQFACRKPEVARLGTMPRRGSLRAVAIVDDSTLSATAKLAAAIDSAGLWTTLGRSQAGRSPDQVSIVIKPELAGFAVGSPTVTDPALIESLIDLLHDRGFTNVAIVGGAGQQCTVGGESRSLCLERSAGISLYDAKGSRPTISSNLGEHWMTPHSQVDSVLHGCAISRDWLDADLRIVFSKSRTDEVAGYALCLDTLIGVLPLIDKDLHYRKRRHPGDVVAALLSAAPVQFCLIDAIVSAHGAGGQRAPAAIDTHTIIAATDIVLADYVGALKMGLDPQVSPTFARILRTHPLPRRYIVTGSLGRYSNWENVPALSLQAAQDARSSRDHSIAWSSRGCSASTPSCFRSNIRWMHGSMRHWPSSLPVPVPIRLLMLANLLLAAIDAAAGSYRTLFDKDALRRHSVPLGLDLDAIPEGAFDALVEELRRLEPVAAAAPQVSSELGWQYQDDAVVFRYTRTLPIDFALFVQRVDICPYNPVHE